MESISRRSLIFAAPSLGLAAAACTQIPGGYDIAGFDVTTSSGGVVSVTLPQNVVTFIQNAVNDVEKYWPTAETIISEALALFPGASSIASVVTIGSTAINAVISALEQLTAPAAGTPATQTAAAHLNPTIMRHLNRASFRARASFGAALIGVTHQGVAVYGVRSS